jgi:hypothetical protein
VDTWKLEIDEERLARVKHAPKCAGCKGACISRASKRVGLEKCLARVLHAQKPDGCAARESHAPVSVWKREIHTPEGLGCVGA